MTAKEFAAALIIAKADVRIDEIKHPLDSFYGYGLNDFIPIQVTLEQVARNIRWQAAYMNGEWDEDEIDNVKYWACQRKRFILKI
jgi:hypothetical protein